VLELRIRSLSPAAGARSNRPGDVGALAAAALAAGVLAAGLLASAASRAQSADEAVSRADLDSPIVPVHDEPHHRQVFQYGPMRILDLQIPPGDISWFHTHEWPVLYMTLGQSAARTQNLGSDWTGGGGRGGGGRAAGARGGGGRGDGARAGGGGGGRGDGARAGGGGGGRAGGGGARGGGGGAAAAPRATSTTSYFEEPITHRLENVGDQLFRAMVVVNETAGDDTTPVEDAGFDGTPELENTWFRSYRVTLEPGATTAAHEHNAPVVIFQATDGTGMAAGPMNFELNEPGQWAFYDTGTGHTIRNEGDAPLELLEIEVRRK